MNYEQLEDEVVAKINPTGLPNVIAVRMPENLTEKTKPLPSGAKITVIYAGSEYRESASTNQIVQEEKIFVQLLIESNFLRGQIGIYSLISLLKKKLTGYSPTGCKKLQVVKHHSISGDELERIDNQWNYSLVFQTTTMHVEDFTEDLSINLKKIENENLFFGENNLIPNP